VPHPSVRAPMGARIVFAAAAALATAVALAPTAAQAAPTRQLTLFVQNATAPAQDNDVRHVVVVRAADGQPAELRNLTFAFDAAGLAGVATLAVKSPSDCATTGTVTTCTLPVVAPVDQFGLAFDSYVVRAAATAPVGKAGTLKVTVSADGFAAVSRKATVTVGEGVDLANASDLETTGAPGATVGAALSVRNMGKTVVNGAVLWLGADFALEFATRYRNCEYVGHLVKCRFTADLNPGVTYQVKESMPFTVRTDTLAPHDTFAQFAWSTVADDANSGDGFADLHPVPGTAPALLLVPDLHPSAKTGDQTDVHPDDNGGVLTVHVTGDNKADLAAVGATLHGAVGETVTANLGVKNLGPATIEFANGDEQITAGRVVVPTQTTAVTVPKECVPVVDGKPDFAHPGQAGAREYQCAGAIDFMPAGASTVWAFALRIDAPGEGRGSVRINLGDDGPDFADDSNRADDTAQILVNPAAAGGGSGGTGGGTGLPVTGSDTALLAGAGLVLVALGALGFVVGRRRRTRFGSD
jgi:LPXTG-motif cell wall-anchored protein